MKAIGGRAHYTQLDLQTSTDGSLNIGSVCLFIGQRCHGQSRNNFHVVWEYIIISMNISHHKIITIINKKIKMPQINTDINVQ